MRKGGKIRPRLFDPEDVGLFDPEDVGPNTKKRKKRKKIYIPFRIRIANLMSCASWPNPETFVVSRENIKVLNADLIDPIYNIKKRLRLQEGFELVNENLENISWRHLHLTETNWRENISKWL